MTVSIATRGHPFPQNLTAATRRYIEALEKHGTYAAAAEALGVSFHTVKGVVHSARMRVGVGTTAELVKLYREHMEAA